MYVTLSTSNIQFSRAFKIKDLEVIATILTAEKFEDNRLKE
jgi:hypothetical protein